VTGGGTLHPNNDDTNCIVVHTVLFDDLNSTPVDHISHGGQLGAPFDLADCGQVLGSPCIRGQWSHSRHYDSTGSQADSIDTTFHTLSGVTNNGVFDTLMCACLGCCGATPDAPSGQFLGVAKKFTLCNPDDKRICGPLPAPAPANAIIFTGLGHFTPQDLTVNGKKAESRYVVFRVYIEDRSEPGGTHSGGAREPATIYCFQAWDTGIAVGSKKTTDYSKIVPGFRTALAQDSCAFISSISTPSQIVNGVVVGGVPPGTMPSSTVGNMAADIVDCGPLYSGSQQIHPSTGATCK
jgi:hypothetical protein